MPKHIYVLVFLICTQLNQSCSTLEESPVDLDSFAAVSSEILIINSLPIEDSLKYVKTDSLIKAFHISPAEFNRIRQKNINNPVFWRKVYQKSEAYLKNKMHPEASPRPPNRQN